MSAPPAAASSSATVAHLKSSSSSSPSIALAPAPAPAPAPRPQGPSKTNQPSTRRADSSESIRMHADLVMVLIQEQRALAARGAAAEVDAARREVGRLRGELDALGRAAVGLHAGNSRGFEELARVRRENGELRARLEGVGAERREGEVVRMKREEGLDEEEARKRLGEGADVDGWRRRCEELERENERLRARERNLVQRLEIFESLNANVNAPLVPTENLPDLNGAMQALRGVGHRLSSSSASASQGQEDVQGKKRRLDEAQATGS